LDSVSSKENLKTVDQNLNDSIKGRLLDSIFKDWIRDTLKIINENEDREIGVLSRRIEVMDDSSLLKVSYKISKVINSRTKYSTDTFIGTVNRMLQVNGVRLPLSDYEIRIKAEVYSQPSSAEQVVHDDWMELPYVSIRLINSNIETVYTLIKGNLTDTKTKEYSQRW
jgi:hypothetical protein